MVPHVVRHTSHLVELSGSRFLDVEGGRRAGLRFLLNNVHILVPSRPYGAEFYEKLRELPYPGMLSGPRDRFYAIETVAEEPKPTNVPSDPPLQLPAALSAAGPPVEVTLRIVDQIPLYRQQLAAVKLRVRLTGNTELDQLSFRCVVRDSDSKRFGKVATWHIILVLEDSPKLETIISSRVATRSAETHGHVQAYH